MTHAFQVSGALFEHTCQLEDFRLAGFRPTGPVYQCDRCAGSTLLHLEGQAWAGVYEEGQSDRLTRFIVEAARGCEAAFQATRPKAGSLHLDKARFLPPRPNCWGEGDFCADGDGT